MFGSLLHDQHAHQIQQHLPPHVNPFSSRSGSAEIRLGHSTRCYALPGRYSGTILNYNIIYILVYVDDTVITGSNTAKVKECLDTLKSEFAVRLCGDLEYFVGIRVRKHIDEVFLDQQLYLVNLLNKHGFRNLKFISIPMQHNNSFILILKVIEKKAIDYRRIIGSLRYLTCVKV